MGTKLLYLTHPQVRIDPSVPVPKWGLSDLGLGRVEAMRDAEWLTNVTRIVSSGETKALETAAVLAEHRCIPMEIRSSLHENDRSSTGFVPPDRFEQIADAFFGEPQRSIEGWERAIDAQARVVRATNDLVEPNATRGDVLVVGHGGVGTLLLCALAAITISRTEDQTGPGMAPGGGNLWGYDRDLGQVVHRWQRGDTGT